MTIFWWLREEKQKLSMKHKVSYCPCAGRNAIQSGVRGGITFLGGGAFPHSIAHIAWQWLPPPSFTPIFSMASHTTRHVREVRMNAVCASNKGFQHDVFVMNVNFQVFCIVCWKLVSEFFIILSCSWMAWHEKMGNFRDKMAIFTDMSQLYRSSGVRTNCWWIVHLGFSRVSHQVVKLRAGWSGYSLATKSQVPLSHPSTVHQISKRSKYMIL